MKTLPVLAAAAVMLSSLAGLDAADLGSLAERSPFSPPGAKAEAVPAEPSQLEFRGMTTDASGTYFSVFDATANRGRWLRAGEGADNLNVKSFDASANLLEVEHNGRALKLPLKRAAIQASAPVPVAATPQAQARPQPGATPAQANPAADARRLEAVAAEVRRRRALRNAAAQQAGAPAPAATEP